MVSESEPDHVARDARSDEQQLMLDGTDRPYRVLVERMHQAAIATTNDGTILYANPHTAELLATPLIDIIGSRIGDHVHPLDRVQVEALLPRSASRDGDAEVRLVRADGRSIRTSVAVATLEQAGDAVLLVVSDLSARDRLLEEQAARSAAEAAATVLREADLRKDEFLAMLAHELRGPLAPLQNGIEILRMRSNHTSEEDRLHGMMARQVAGLVRLVDDLLDASRVTQGKVRLQREPIDLRDVVAAAVERARPAITSREHQFVLREPEAPVPINGDHLRLAQAVANILDNAVKFTPRGGQISLDIEHAGDTARVRVRDNGIGIAAEMMPRIFDLFVQVDPSVSRTEGGLGVGLTLARRLAEMHGGSVSAESAGAGSGTEFVVRVPVAAGDRGPGRLSPPATRLRVLVVDDNIDAAESLATLLRLRGHDVRHELDGEAAVRTEATFRPDVMLLDIGLPGLDGHQVAERIRARATDDRPRLIALSGYGSAEDRRRSQASGFDEHMVKPVELAALDATLAATNPRPSR